MENLYVAIRGEADLLMHSLHISLNEDHPWKIEEISISRKRASSRTEQEKRRLKQLGCMIGAWLDDNGVPTVNHSAFRACIEAAARKEKEGPDVREGLLVLETTKFQFKGKSEFFPEDADREDTRKNFEMLCSREWNHPEGGLAYSVPVTVQRAKLLRTRPRFQDWSAEFYIQYDPDLVDERKLRKWATVAGQRIGIGDWRPAKSGTFGRFTLLGFRNP